MSKVCFECRKPGHFKEDCSKLKKKYEEDSKEKEKLKKKSAWMDAKKKKKKKKKNKKKKTQKATWSDSSDNQKSEQGTEDEEVNLCLFANSSEGEYDISDALPEDLQEVLEEIFMKFKSIRKELKKVKNENLHQLVKILCLTEDLEMIDYAPKENIEVIKRLRELELENIKIIKEEITLKEEVESLILVTLTKPLADKDQDEFINLRESMKSFLVAKRHLTCYK